MAKGKSYQWKLKTVLPAPKIPLVDISSWESGEGWGGAGWGGMG